MYKSSYIVTYRVHICTYQKLTTTLRDTNHQPTHTTMASDTESLYSEEDNVSVAEQSVADEPAEPKSAAPKHKTPSKAKSSKSQHTVFIGK